MGTHSAGVGSGEPERGALMNAIPTLLYHRVCSEEEYFNSSYVVQARAFRQQMEYLARRGWKSATVADVIADRKQNQSAAKKVLITFDDGYLDNYTNAFPILKDYGFTALVLLIGDMSRRTNWWDVPLGVPEAKLLMPHQIREMAEGGIEFGSHSLTHRSLPGLSDAQLEDEVVGSKRVIEKVTGCPVTAFSYPYSHIDEKTKRAVQAAGYRVAFSVESGPFRTAADPWEVRRTNVTSSAQGFRFALKLNGVERCRTWFWWRSKRALRILQGRRIRRGF
jgi:peptidoglycan/xylan/chitin deacetylase (PgdA/CDA1 family)